MVNQRIHHSKIKYLFISLQGEMSRSSIKVSRTFECLNLTASLGNIEEIKRNSDVNVFNLKSISFDESYLNLFKSPEDFFYDNVMQKRLKPCIHIVRLEEQSDDESDYFDGADEQSKGVLESESTQKILDFVPLDEATKPVFNKTELIDSDESIKEQSTSKFGSNPSSINDNLANLFLKHTKLNNENDIGGNEKPPTNK